MNALFKVAVDANTAHPQMVGFVTIWDGVDKQPAPPNSPTPWARVAIRHNSGGQKSLANDRGKKRFTRTGFVVIQLFTNPNDGLVSNDEITAILLSAYEGKTTSGGVFFRNVRSQEVGQDGAWYQTNVFADFEYEQIK